MQMNKFNSIALPLVLLVYQLLLTLARVWSFNDIQHLQLDDMEVKSHFPL